MQIDEIIWQQQFVEKLATKHGVEKTEVEEVLTNCPHFVSSLKAIGLVKMFTRRWDKPTRDVISSFFLSENQIVER